MPTLFRRRYLRGLQYLGPTEIIAGVLVFALAVAIAVGFASQVATEGKSLYAVEESAYHEEEAPHALQAAGQFLPKLESAGLVAGKLEAVEHTAVEFEQYGVVYAHQRTYAPGDAADIEVTAVLCDVATPAQAFGLCRARRPEHWDPMRGGHDGWMSASASRAGFWRGRYYTELSWTTAGEQVTDAIARIAQSLGSLQLDYGWPLPGDVLLPEAGRVPDTLQYMHRNALGFEGLNQTYLADYQSGMRTLVSITPSASDASDLVQQLAEAKPQAVEAGGPEGDGHGGDMYGGPGTAPATEVRQEGPLTIVPLGDRQLAVFAAGADVYGTLGADADAVVAAADELYAQVTASAAGPRTGLVAAEPTAADNPFPTPGVSGWAKPRNVDRFTADNLYVKINGRADAYLQFNVVELRFGTYFNEAAPDRTVDVYWYDMGKPVNAFGIYQAESPPHPDAIDVGKDGYAAGGAVFFHKGGSYVQVLPASADASDADVALAIARRIADEVEDSGEGLWAERMLPADGRVEGSFAYQAQNVFGLDFLSDVFTADYEVDGMQATLFIHKAPDSATATNLLSAYTEFFEKYGKVAWHSEDPSKRIVAGEVAGVVDVVFVHRQYVGGVSGADDVETARQAAEQFLSKLADPE